MMIASAKNTHASQIQISSENDDTQWVRPEYETGAIHLYLKEMIRYPLLTPEEVIHLFKGIEANQAKIVEIALKYPSILQTVCPESEQRPREKPLPRQQSCTNTGGNARFHSLQGIFKKLDLTDRNIEIIIDKLEGYAETMVFAEHLTENNQKLSDLSPVDFEKLKALKRSISEMIPNFWNRYENMEQGIVTALSDPSQPASAVSGMSARITRDREALLGAHKAIKNAEGEIVSRNLRLVNSVAMRYANSGVPLIDLIQEGNIGLLKAIKRFDYRRGFRFSTYAVWWIRQAISRGIHDHGLTIRMPVHMHIRLNKVKRIYRELSTRTGRPATPEEIARETDLPVEKVRESLEIARKSETLSLDKPLGGDDDFNLECLISDSADSPEEHSMQRDIAERLSALLEVLTPREREIIRKRFGMDDDTDHTLQQLAEEFGISRERIRQIQNQALDKLRRAMKGKEMWDVGCGMKSQ